MQAQLGQKSADETYVAVDFGTRVSRIAYAKGEGQALVADLSGDPEIPTALTLTPDGGMLGGFEAHSQQTLFPAETILSLRALMTADPAALAERGALFPHPLVEGEQLLQIEAGGRKRTAMELAGLYLLHLRRTAELAMERPVESAVLTVPVSFTPLDRQAYRLAARMAGFRRVRLIDEPTAVALTATAAGLVGRVVAVSWGVGYFGLSLLEARRDIVKVLASGGSSRIGGGRIEQEMVRDFMRRHRSTTPLFTEVGQEFLAYLQDERGPQAGDWPFMLELAHYEYVELDAMLHLEGDDRIRDQRRGRGTRRL